MKKVILFSFLVFAANVNFAQYALDWTFNSGGVVIDHMSSDQDIINDMVIQPDGKIIVAGNTHNASGWAFAISRYNVDGSPDTGFDGDGHLIIPAYDVSNSCNTVVLQPDGNILLGGTIKNTSGSAATDLVLIRLLPDGSFDPVFGIAGIAVTDIDYYEQINAIALQADGKIVAATSNGYHLVQRFNSNGTLDTGFVPATISLLSYATANSVNIMSTGKIQLAGISTYGLGPPPYPTYSMGIAVCYNSDGSIDTTFNYQDSVYYTGGFIGLNFINTPGNSWFYSSILQLDGKILLGGGCSELGNKSGIFRLNANGSLDSSFGTAGKVLLSTWPTQNKIYALNLQADGKIIAAGFSSWGPNTDLAMARLNVDGSLDPSFGVGGILITNLGGNDLCYASVLQNDDKILIAGSSNFGPDTEFLIARFNANANSVNEFQISTNFSIYPNPANGNVTISTKNEFANATIKLIDLSGQVILVYTNVNGNSVSLDISQQLPGLYFVEIQNAGNITRSKLVKN